MRFIEDIRKDRIKISQMETRKEKLLFIWDYYKFVIIAVVCILLIGGISVGQALRAKDVAMYVVTLNSDYSINEVDETVFMDGLVKEGYEPGDKVVDVNDFMSLGGMFTEEEDISTMQVLTALFTISDLDVFVADEEYFAKYVEDDGYADLSKLIDGDILNSQKLYKHVNSDGVEVVDGIYLEPGSMLHKAGYYHDEVLIGACASGNNLEEAILFIKSLID